MEICANYSLGKCENSQKVKIESGEFTHLVVDYEYFHCRNQARVKKIKLQKIEHKIQKIYMNKKGV